VIVARPLNDSEPDLLVGNEQKTLVITNLDKKELHRVAASNNGWTHDELESINYYGISSEWEAYLGSQWIGSSEV